MSGAADRLRSALAVMPWPWGQQLAEGRQVSTVGRPGRRVRSPPWLV